MHAHMLLDINPDSLTDVYRKAVPPCAYIMPKKEPWGDLWWHVFKQVFLDCRCTRLIRKSRWRTSPIRLDNVTIITQPYCPMHTSYKAICDSETPVAPIKDGSVHCQSCLSNHCVQHATTTCFPIHEVNCQVSSLLCSCTVLSAFFISDATLPKQSSLLYVRRSKSLSYTRLVHIHLFLILSYASRTNLS